MKDAYLLKDAYNLQRKKVHKIICRLKLFVARFCWLGIASHSESVVETDKVSDYNTTIFRDYRFEIRATMAGGTKSAKSKTLCLIFKSTELIDFRFVS
ncbi:hypothetical protein [Lentilactobacillus otakiensis]|uniref:hypothetical protein n=1 Tax=Lentilactobacillus otakiensis TaxID=481720 RepID=UPI003D1816A0